MNTAYVGEYQEYIDSMADWDIWLTVTFKYPASSESAFKSFRYFFKRLNTPELVFFEKFIRCIVLTEKHERRASAHIHCLIHGIAPSLARSLEDKCRGFFGSSVAKAYDSELPRLASEYMAKKCADGVAEDWKVMKINAKWRGGKQ